MGFYESPHAPFAIGFSHGDPTLSMVSKYSKVFGKVKVCLTECHAAGRCEIHARELAVVCLTSSLLPLQLSSVVCVPSDRNSRFHHFLLLIPVTHAASSQWYMFFSIHCLWHRTFLQ